ncbi:MAG: hypothetical protein P8X57_07275 [Cyclobacteriaceae bacterium]
MKKWLTAIILLLVTGIQTVIAQQDTLLLKNTEILILKDSVFIPDKDTLIIIPPDIKYRVKPNPYIKSDGFYEKLKNKSEKSRLASELYELLIRDSTNNVTDKKNGVKSEEYFLDFKGYVISKVSIQHVQMITGNTVGHHPK